MFRSYLGGYLGLTCSTRGSYKGLHKAYLGYGKHKDYLRDYIEPTCVVLAMNFFRLRDI